MTKRASNTTLEHYGLSIDQLLAGSHGVPMAGASTETSIIMRNDVIFSKCCNPSVPVAKGRLELIRVELKGTQLTIADIWGEGTNAEGLQVERVGARLYAVKTMELAGATIYMLLSALPPGGKDEKFFAANGTVVLFDDPKGGPRALKACGTDQNSGACQGWIFDAIEI
jgi:hypothetical protein